MELPVLHGIIDRRILINYRADPTTVKKLLPDHLEPLVINGYASAGICLLRLKNIGIKYSPSFLRITSENSAHRFLVQWKEEGRDCVGVYIPRRDTDSFLNVWLAGKIFSWPHFAATFETHEGGGSYTVAMHSNDYQTRVSVKTELTDVFPADSMFDSLMHASDCFKLCAVGYSPSTVPNGFKTIQLKTKTWAVKPLKVNQLSSSFFEDQCIFPKDTIHFDNALLMEAIEHEWRPYHSGT